MADGVAITAGSGTTILTDDTGAPGHAQVVKLAISTDGSSVLLPSDATDGMLVNLGANNDVTVTGTVSVSASTVPVTDNGGSLTVDDGGSSLTVDGTVAISGTVAVTDNASTLSIDDGGGAITVDGTVTANAGSGPWPVTDNGGSLTVDGSVSVTGAVDTELPAAAALADNTVTPTAPAVGAFGMVYDGATWDFQRGTAADGTLVNLGANNDVTVTGTVSVSASTIPITDNGGSLTVDGTVTANAGTGPWPVTDNGGTLSIDDGSGSITVDGTVAVSGTVAVTDNSGSLTVDGSVTLAKTSTNTDGVAVFRSLDLDETEEDVKTSAGTLYGFIATNRSTSSRYVKFYNGTAAGVTVGSSTPNLTVGIPGVSGEIVSMVYSLPVPFGYSTGLCVAATTGFADSDTGAPATNDVIINVFYA